MGHMFHGQHMGAKDRKWVPDDRGSRLLGAGGRFPQSLPDCSVLEYNRPQ